MIHVTYFDRRFLPQGLALIKSMIAHGRGVRLVALCLDDETDRVLTALRRPELIVMPLWRLEARYPELLSAKANRSLLEYYFTLTPYLIAYAYDCFEDAQIIIYVDADIFFFDDPTKVTALMGEGLIGLTPHGFSHANAHREARAGRYNNGWMGFRRSEEAARCLQRYQRCCLASCSEDAAGRYGDQKYLDDWSTHFAGVVDITHPGCNLAEWNIEDRPLTLEDGAVKVGGHPLLFHHFSRILHQDGQFIAPAPSDDYFKRAPIYARHVVEPYLATLQAMARLLTEFGCDAAAGESLRRDAILSSLNDGAAALAALSARPPAMGGI